MRLQHALDERDDALLCLEARAPQDGGVQSSNVLVAPVKAKRGFSMKATLENGTKGDGTVFNNFFIAR